MPDAAAVEFLPQMPSAAVPYQLCMSLICAVVRLPVLPVLLLWLPPEELPVFRPPP